MKRYALRLMRPVVGRVVDMSELQREAAERVRLLEALKKQVIAAGLQGQARAQRWVYWCALEGEGGYDLGAPQPVMGSPGCVWAVHAAPSNADGAVAWAAPAAPPALPSAAARPSHR